MRIDQYISGEAVDRLTDVLLLVGLDGTILDANQAALDCYGYSHDEMQALSIFDIRTPQDRAAATQQLREATERGFQHETDHRRRDGSVFPVEARARVVANGEAAMLIVARDITERRQAQEALIEAEWKFKALFEKGPIGVAYHQMIHDASGKAIDYRFLDANERYLELTGVDPRGMTVTQAFPGIEDDPFDWIGTFGHVARTGETIRFEQYLQANDRWYDVVGYQYKPDHFVAAFLEVTEYKRAQGALRESVDTFRFIFENSVVAQSITLPTGEAQGNDAFYQLLGYSQEELADNTTWMQLTYPDDVALSQREANVLLSGEQASTRFEKRYVHKDGSIVWADVSTSLRRDAAGQPLYFMTTVLDITERKRAQVELERRGARLEELLEEREAHLEKLAASLSSIIGVVGQVVETRDPYTAGHERRVSELAVRIAEELGLTAEQIEEIRIAALIHDVGKMSVPTEILSKPGKLSFIEFELIKGHAEAGYMILASANMEGSITEMVYQHHERCDGSGYPRGLSADELLEGSKVLAVSDVVEAMVSHRPYRPGLGIEPALAEIERGSGTQYDAAVVDACLRAFRTGGFVFSEI